MSSQSPATSPSPLSSGGFRKHLKWIIPLALVLLLIVFPLIGSYNGMVTKRNEVKKQFANVDTQLQRRFDLIPNLVEAVKASLGQEQQVFGQIADARTRYAGATTPDQKVEASNQMESALARLMVIVENYPQLQSNERVRDLMTQLEGTENRIGQERRIYNDVANSYNTSIQKFPRNIVAGIFGFDEFKLFEAEATAKTAPKVDLGVTPSTKAPAGGTTASSSPSTASTMTPTTTAAR